MGRAINAPPQRELKPGAAKRQVAIAKILIEWFLLFHAGGIAVRRQVYRQSLLPEVSVGGTALACFGLVQTAAPEGSPASPPTRAGLHVFSAVHSSSWCVADFFTERVLACGVKDHKEAGRRVVFSVPASAARIAVRTVVHGIAREWLTWRRNL
jgi:hypothetical protein